MLAKLTSVMSNSLWPRGLACQATLSMGFSKQEYWSGLSSPPPGDSPDSGIEPKSLVSPALVAGLFTNSAAEEMKQMPYYHHQKPNLNLNSWQGSWRWISQRCCWALYCSWTWLILHNRSVGQKCRINTKQLSKMVWKLGINFQRHFDVCLYLFWLD